mmetsp:Transcript_1218/g.2773  ORF Transcript_1218/g.2773 Transcript_1218/m.2773 type:complete len:256 (-) Transcript_1218:130-897(-)
MNANNAINWARGTANATRAICKTGACRSHAVRKDAGLLACRGGTAERKILAARTTKYSRIGTRTRAGSDVSSLFEGKSSDKGESASKEDQVEEVELVSEAGLSYELLRDLLSQGEWEKADAETRLKMIELAGSGAKSRGWVYFTEVKDIPVADLKTIDALWKSYSGGKFGFSVQKRFWLKGKKVWTSFFKQIDWVQGENNNYRKFPLEFFWGDDAPPGHLPLTNCLRGTQLLQAILEHPAFLEPKKKASSSPIQF